MSAPVETSMLAELEAHPFLRGLSPEMLAEMARHTERRDYASEVTIAREGDPALEFLLIVSGKVALEMVPVDRPHLTILTLGPGEVFGWSWLAPPHHWRVDARTLKPTRVLVIPGHELRRILEARPADGYQFLLRLVPVLGQRLDATRLQVLDVHSG